MISGKQDQGSPGLQAAAYDLNDRRVCAMLVSDILNADDRSLDRVACRVAEGLDRAREARQAIDDLETAVLDVQDADWQEHWRNFPFDEMKRKVSLTDELLPTGMDARAHLDLIRRVGAALADGAHDVPRLPDEDAYILAKLATEGMELFLAFPTRIVRPPGLLLLSAVARGLYSIANGDLRLTRCPAPAPDGAGARDLCGRYFVRGGKLGTQQEHCSDTCRKRAQRWRKKLQG